MDLIESDRRVVRTQRVYLNSSQAISVGKGIQGSLEEHDPKNPLQFDVTGALIHPRDSETLSVSLVHFACNGNIQMFGDERTTINLNIFSPGGIQQMKLELNTRPETTLYMGMSPSSVIEIINNAITAMSETGITTQLVLAQYLTNQVSPLFLACAGTTDRVNVYVNGTSESIWDLLGLARHKSTSQINDYAIIHPNNPVQDVYQIPNTGVSRSIIIGTDLPQQNYCSYLNTSNILGQVPLKCNQIQFDDDPSNTKPHSIWNYVYTNEVMEGSHKAIGAISPNLITFTLFMNNGAKAVMNGNWDIALEFKTLGRKL
jgi:hypothetical protein